MIHFLKQLTGSCVSEPVHILLSYRHNLLLQASQVVSHQEPQVAI
jgi:hypothetical protein